jgi:glycogen synthase
VSDLVAETSEKIFGRRPDIIVYNGLDIKKYNFEKSKRKMDNFVRSYFYPYYYLEMENTVFYFISGRYEVLSKGIDIFIKALGKLNNKLKDEESRKKVVVFILIPAATKRVSDEVIRNYLLFLKINEKISDNFKLLRRRIINYILFKKENKKDILDEIDRSLKILKKNGNPPLTTHELVYDDQIMKMLKENNLQNSEEDGVKIIYYPAYLEEGDGLLNLDYYEFIKGLDLGIFPSFYEPWGYTPLECIYLGVPSMTTDLSGFGYYIDGRKNTGVTVIGRRNSSDDEAVERLKDEMYSYLNLSRIQRMKNRVFAEEYGQSFSWKYLIENYLKAYHLALKRKGER